MKHLILTLTMAGALSACMTTGGTIAQETFPAAPATFSAYECVDIEDIGRDNAPDYFLLADTATDSGMFLTRDGKYFTTDFELDGDYLNWNWEPDNDGYYRKAFYIEPNGLGSFYKWQGTDDEQEAEKSAICLPAPDLQHQIWHKFGHLMTKNED